MFQLRGQGFIKAGSEGNIVIGHGERWWVTRLPQLGWVTLGRAAPTC